MNSLKNTFKTLLYYLVLLLSVLDILGIVASFYYFVRKVIDIYNKAKITDKPIDLSFYIESGAIFIVLMFFVFVICIILIFVLSQSRINLRNKIYFDENGMHKKWSGYDKVSKKEKDHIDKQKLMDVERILDSATLRQITHEGSKDPIKDMDNLIGLQDVKQTMREMAARMEFEEVKRKDKKKKKKSKGKLSTSHMCFMGPPGTGKTTCARIMTGFLYKYKYIRKNQYIEIDGNFLKGNYQGETSKKTARIIQKALGGVLFIDEAYALLERVGNGFGQEAIATIVKEMEDKKDDLVIIFAGYDKEMKELIDSNPGLYSRIKDYVYFNNYSIEELGLIFNFMANSEGFYVPHESIEKFKGLIFKDVKDKNFGNARTVRNYLDKIINKHSLNLMDKVINKDDTYRLCVQDIDIRK